MTLLNDEIKQHLVENSGANSAQKKLNLSMALAIGGAVASGLAAALPSVAVFLPPQVTAVVTGLIAILNLFTKSNVTTGVRAAFLSPSPLSNQEVR